MGYEVVREDKEDCGCVVEHLEHDFWSSSSETRHHRCQQHEMEYQKEEEEWNERNRQKQEEEARLREEKLRLENERLRKKREERDCFLEELKRIATGPNCQVPLNKIVPDLKTRKRLIKDHINGMNFTPDLNIEKIKNRWMCKKEATLFYMDKLYNFKLN